MFRCSMFTYSYASLPYWGQLHGEPPQPSHAPFLLKIPQLFRWCIILAPLLRKKSINSSATVVLFPIFSCITSSSALILLLFRLALVRHQVCFALHFAMHFYWLTTLIFHIRRCHEANITSRKHIHMRATYLREPTAVPCQMWLSWSKPSEFVVVTFLLSALPAWLCFVVCPVAMVLSSRLTARFCGFLHRAVLVWWYLR